MRALVLYLVLTFFLLPQLTKLQKRQKILKMAWQHIVQPKFPTFAADNQFFS